MSKIFVLILLFSVWISGQFNCLPLVLNMSSNFTHAVNNEVIGFTKDLEGNWSDSYYFIFATDPQPGLVDLVEGGDGSKWEAEIERTITAVTAINNMTPKPRFVLIGGDIVDAFPGTEHRPRQLLDLRQAFSSLDPAIPLLAISGNHDIGNVPTNSTMAEYRNEFGDEYFSFWVGGVFYIAINSQCFFDSSETAEICQGQSAWLEKQLQSARTNRCAHVVVFMHIPLFVSNPEEENTYFSIHRPKRLELLQQFANAGVEKVFSGHYHRNAGGNWTRTNEDGSTSKIEVVVTTAIGAQLGNDDPGLRVVRVKKTEISHQFYALTDVPSSVTLQ